MAIAFDTSASTAYVGGTSHSMSYTCTGSNLVLFAGIFAGHVGVTNDCTGVTYNGVSMTKIAESRDTGSGSQGAWQSLWYLLNPATGSNTLAASFSNSDGSIIGGASYTGVKQSGMPDASNTNTGTLPLTTSVTTVADNCWTILTVRPVGTCSAGTGSTQRENQGAGGYAIFDSNGVIHPAGSTSMGVNGSVASAIVMASFAPAVAATVNAGPLLMASLVL